MTSVDNRVVNMQFNNAQFEAGVAQTLRSLQALNQGLKLEGATKGLTDLNTAGKNVNLSHIEQGVDAIANKFKAMSVIAITALSTIAHQAILTGETMLKALTIDPIKAGLAEYETNLNSIQTILANTGLEGPAGLAKVTAALDILNAYSDQTIYNFSEMAKNIGTFTAAGVKLDVATSAIKGIANLAAISGSNAEQASTAMYQLSQALAAGKVSLMDWNSVVNAGMGGKVFQEALMETARVHGVAIDKMIKDAGSFRSTLEKGWLSSEILTETLSKFTGDLTHDQLKSMGYNEKQIAGILKLGRTAKDAATKVKTFSQLMGTLEEAVGSGWAKTFQLIIGDFDEAKDLFTGINNVIGGFISTSADARNKVIGDWKELGGRTALIDSVKNAWQALVSVVSPIKEAFREIFPAATGKQLYDITVAIRNFTSTLKIGSDTAENLRRTFAGVFALLGIGWDILKEGVGFLLKLFGVVTKGSGSILEFTGNIGDFIVGLRSALKEGKGLEKFFDGLQKFLEPPIKLLRDFAKFIGSLFDGFDGKKAADGVTGLVKKLDPLENLGHNILKIWTKVFDFLDDAFNNFYQFAHKVTDAVKGLGTGVSDSLGGINFSGIMALFTGGAFGAFLLSLRTMTKNVSGIFDSLTGSLKTMQNTLRAATLVEIAIAIGLLTLSVTQLAKINPGDMATAGAGLAAMFTELLGAMLIFEKLSGFKGFAKMPFIAASMILLSTAILILTQSVKQLAELDIEGLKRGLAGVALLLAMVITTMELMPNPAGIIGTSVGIVILAAALHILVGAVTDLAAMDWQTMARGLVGVGTLLGALVLFSTFAKADALGVLSGAGIVLLAVGLKILGDVVKDMAKMSWAEIARGMTVLGGGLLAMGLALSLVPPTAPIVAAGFLILAPALIIMADAIKKMSGLSWSEIGRGMTVLAGALTAIGLALTFVPPTAPLVAAGFLILAPALLIIGDAIAKMSKLGWEQIAKGLVTLAGALAIISVAVTAMTASIAGAAALVIVAAALAILAPILLLFSKMSWEEMGKGLLMLAGVFVVLGAAGLVLAGLVPALIGLGVAITLLGIGVLAAGAGVLLFATALTALAIAGSAGTLALVAMVGALAGLIPEVMKQIGLGVVAFATAISQSGPALVAAIVAVLTALMDAIVKLIPKIQETLATLLTKMLETMLSYMPKMIDMGLKLIAAFLQGVANNIGRVIDSAVNLGVNFLQGLQKNLPRIIQAGVDFVLAFINGVADVLRSSSAKIGEAGANLGSALIEGMLRALVAGAGKIASKAADIAKSALNAAKKALGISSPSKEFMKLGRQMNEGMALGLQTYSKVVTKESEALGKSSIDALKSSINKMSLSNDMDTRPVIRPVLDLTDVQKGAGDVNKMFMAHPIIATTTSSNASDAAVFFRSRPPDDPANGAMTNTSGVSFVQNNYSPKALPPAEIYRQTNNQLSRIKEALPT